MANSTSNFKSNYFGKEGKSTENFELIQSFKIDPDKNTSLVALSLNFIPQQDCTVAINGSDPIPFKAGREFVMDTGRNMIHKTIDKFQIVEADIDYWCMGVLKD